MRGLPEDAALRRGSVEQRLEKRRREEWTLQHELLAIVADRTGIAASAEQYAKAPKPLTRPDWFGKPDTERAEAPQPQGTGIKRAISVLAGSARRVVG